MSNQKLKDKIAALLRKANDKTTTQAESEAFMGKVEELLQEHQLSYMDIDEHIRDKEDPLSEHHLIFCPNNWMETAFMFSEAALYYHTRAVFTEAPYVMANGKTKNRLCMRLFGRESARITTEIMVKYLFNECSRRGGREHRASKKLCTVESFQERLLEWQKQINLSTTTVTYNENKFTLSSLPPMPQLNDFLFGNTVSDAVKLCLSALAIRLKHQNEEPDKKPSKSKEVGFLDPLEEARKYIDENCETETQVCKSHLDQKAVKVISDVSLGHQVSAQTDNSRLLK